MENTKKEINPPQHQDCQPGKESVMNPLPQFENANYKASGKLLDKVAIITGATAVLVALLQLPMQRKAQMLL